MIDLIPHAIMVQTFFIPQMIFFLSFSFVSYPILLTNNMHTIFDYKIYITCFTFPDQTSLYLYMYQEHRIPSIEQTNLTFDNMYINFVFSLLNTCH